MASETKIGKRRRKKLDKSSEFYRERRAEIVKAAADTFQERGYDGTTLSIIAEKLNADRASLYYYFASKQDLFREIVREAAHSSVTSAEEIAKKDWPADKKLIAAFETVMQNYETSYPYMHVFLQENFPSLTASEDSWISETREWATRYYHAIRSIIQQGEEEGTFKLPLPVGVTTMGVLGTVNWAHRWYKPGGKLSSAEIGNGFAEMLLKGLVRKT